MNTNATLHTKLKLYFNTINTHKKSGLFLYTKTRKLCELNICFLNIRQHYVVEEITRIQLVKQKRNRLPQPTFLRFL